mmetsp:Transcript_38196/g.51695  ORF Transcript_38196/g.51695 Transcript_38196/m.51695 type:complete len:178 (-) Transcript_38196:112-645(-)
MALEAFRKKEVAQQRVFKHISPQKNVNLVNEILQRAFQKERDENLKKSAAKLRGCRWAVPEKALVKQRVIDRKKGKNDTEAAKLRCCRWAVEQGPEQWNSEHARGFLCNFILPPHRRIESERAEKLREKIEFLTHNTHVDLCFDVAEIMDPDKSKLKKESRKKSNKAQKKKKNLKKI